MSETHTNKPVDLFAEKVFTSFLDSSLRIDSTI